jgi:hypothetical protein
MKTNVKRLPATLALVVIAVTSVVLPNQAFAEAGSEVAGGDWTAAFTDSAYVDSVQALETQQGKFQKAGFGFIGGLAIWGLAKRVK